MNLSARLGQALVALSAKMVPVEKRQGMGTLHWPGMHRFFQTTGAPGEVGNPLTFSAVYQCVNLIADDIAKLPIRIYEGRRGSGRDEIFEHSILDLFAAPNPIQTRNDFFKDIVTALLLRGNAYALTTFDARQRPVEMWPVHPDRASPSVGADGSVHYSLSLSALESGIDGGQSVSVPARSVMHHHTFTPGHPLIGVAPMLAASLSTEIGQRIAAHSNAFYGNLARPSGTLQTESTLDAPTVERLREQFTDAYSGDNVGRPLVLEAGMKYSAITMNAHDAQLIQTLDWAVEDVARAFRVPVFMLGRLGGVTYSNAEQLQSFYYQQCLQPHIEALESRIDRFFGLWPKYHSQFDLNALLRAETAARIDSLGKGVQNGIYTSNEARAVEGLNPVDGGDQVFMQQQMRPITQLTDEPLGAVPDSEQTAAARRETHEILDRVMSASAFTDE